VNHKKQQSWRADDVLLRNNVVLPNPLGLLKSHGVVDVRRRWCAGSKIISRVNEIGSTENKTLILLSISFIPSIETKNLLELNIDPTIVITPADVFGGEEIETHLSIRPASEYYVISVWCCTSPRCIS
jgi:hypothetical protein